jgi:hypothetical protein
MQSILIIIDYFGSWPEWFPVFLASCEANPTIHWHIHTDCPIPPRRPANVRFFSISMIEYYKKVGRILDISIPNLDPYKICNIRTAFGVIYEHEIRPFDYFGYGDMDVIYGDIRKFYTDKVLTKSFISTHYAIASGHLTLFKNENWLRNAFRRISRWKAVLEMSEPTPWTMNLNESGFTQVFRRSHFLSKNLRRKFHISDRLDDFLYRIFLPYWRRHARNSYFKEQYTTPFTPLKWHDGRPDHPRVWYWKNGHITNNRDNEREFIYLHLMNFRKARHLNRREKKKVFWEELPGILRFDVNSYAGENVRIDEQGIHRIDEAKMR